MRLRLRIERNGLPPSSVLWPISDTERKLTIAQLLQLVDEKIPLEAANWGLEDYIVTVGGYEALHYSELDSVCKDEDEVVIRALQWRDRKLRMLAGRDQISGDGRHLVDGVPFGRPLIKHAVRPEVTIPPLKAPQQSYEPGYEATSSAVNELALLENSDHDGNQDIEDVDNYFSGDDDFDNDEADSVDDSDGDNEEETLARQSQAFNTTQSENDITIEISDSVSSDSDTDSGSDADSDSDSDSSESSSEASEESESEDSFKGIITEPEEAQRMVAARYEQSAQNSYSATKRKRNGVDESTADTKRPKVFNDPPTNTSQVEEQVTGQPLIGSEATRVRNQRRRNNRKLQQLKRLGILPPDAKFDALFEWKSNNPSTRTVDSRLGPPEEHLEMERQRLLQMMHATGGIDVTPNAQPDQQDVSIGHEADDLPEELSSTDPLDRTSKYGDDLTDKPSLLLGNTENVMLQSNAKPKLASTDRFSRVSAANRMIFGSLGVRTPKTQDEADALKTELHKRASRSKAAPKPFRDGTTETDLSYTASAEAQDADEDPDEWRNRLSITAVECYDEGITLSTPPFPFRHQWDSQYQKKRNDAAHGGPSKRREKASRAANANESYVETYDKYNNSNGDALNYDDDDDDEDVDDPYWEEGALLESYDEKDDTDAANQQLLTETMAQSSVDDFPALPEDTSTLPDLREEGAKEGDFVVYKELACSVATNWQPNMVTRTVRLEAKSDDGWTATIALRDLAPKKFDDDGERVYGKFEMAPFSDEDEHDERTRLITWNEILEPKLLQRCSKD